MVRTFSSFLIQQIKARKKSILELDDGDLIDESNLIDEEEEERQRPVYPPGRKSIILAVLWLIVENKTIIFSCIYLQFLILNREDTKLNVRRNV